MSKIHVHRQDSLGLAAAAEAQEGDARNADGRLHRAAEIQGEVVELAVAELASVKPGLECSFQRCEVLEEREERGQRQKPYP